MAQPTPVAHAAARSRLTGPFYDPAAYGAAEQRAFELRQLVQELTNPASLLPEMQPSANPFNTHTATRTEMFNGRRVPSVYYNIEPEHRVAQALSQARHEQEIVRAAMALFSPAQPLQVTPAVSGPYRSPQAPKSAAGPLGVLVELLTRTADLNSNESSELAKKRGPAYSNTGEYNQLLQQVLNSGTAKGP